MIFSMTGFGREEGTVMGNSVAVELRSVNNRFLETAIRTPRKWSSFEEPLRNLLQKEFARGKIELQLLVNEEKRSLNRYRINEPVFLEYVRLIREFRKRLQIDESINIGQILSLPELLIVDEDIQEHEKFWKGLQKIVQAAMKKLRDSQGKEGTVLVKDLKKRIIIIKRNLKEILRVIPKKRKALMQNLKAKVQQLVIDKKIINRDRLELEIAILAEKSDITEESVRLQSHLELFLDILKEGGSVGKRLDFTLQEMNREINTIGAKGSNFSISRHVIEVKDEIEKLKEQIRNLV